MSPTAKAVKPQVLLSKKLTGSLGQINEMIEDNAKLMDLVQEIALELTHSIGVMHSLTVKYSGRANRVLDVVMPILGNLPFVPKRARSLLADLESLTARITDGQASTKKTIAGVKRGLSTANINKLSTQADELRSMTRGLLAVLPK